MCFPFFWDAPTHPAATAKAAETPSKERGINAGAVRRTGRNFIQILPTDRIGPKSRFAIVHVGATGKRAPNQIVEFATRRLTRCCTVAISETRSQAATPFLARCGGS